MIQARQKKINDKCKEIVVSSASDQTTMESIVSAQHGLQTINQVVQIANIAFDDAEILTSEVHDPYARTTGAWR